MKALLGRKVGMTQIFDDNGAAVPVTVIEAGPCVVTQIKTTERDGYDAVQIGFGKPKRLGKSQVGHQKASGTESKYLREFPIDNDSDLKVGSKLELDMF